MPNLGRSILDTTSLTSTEIFSLFTKANNFEVCYERSGQFLTDISQAQNKVVACVFLEASTRTRMSFQIAAYRLGAQVVSLEQGPTSSLSKGETYSDTILNIQAMNPDALVIRYGDLPELDQLLPGLTIPVLNAGSGKSAHPTQALLDAYTIFRAKGSLENQKVLVIGDVAHSRVARSNIDVLTKLGAQVGLCAPAVFLPPKDEFRQLQIFSNLDEGVKWATVCMGLRVQLERHSDGSAFDSIAYHSEFGLNRNRLQSFANDGIIMHPGPINHGVEFSSEVLQDSRSLILKQVGNGVLIRAALLANALELETK